jgi:alkylresorcinol/alkylpyrone synthase
MFITGLGTATPSTRYTQTECWEALQESERFTTLAPRSRAILRKVLANSSVTTRFLSLNPLTEAFRIDPDTLHARFREHAPELAARAGRNALDNAGLESSQVDAVLISTCTGYLCPGLTSYVAERLGLSPQVFALDLVGQGCGAALPNLRTAGSLLGSGQAQNVLSICVEVCSAAFYLDDDPGVLISACLFGDGAGAAVLSSKASRLGNSGRRITVNRPETLLVPSERDTLRFETCHGMLRNILSSAVPARAGHFVAQLFDQTMAKNGLKAKDITGWVFHPGGRDVLRELQASLGLGDNEVRWSTAVLRDYGNLSSASVFFVLQQALSEKPPGGHWWMSSFGAGFSCHGTLLEVE